MAAYIDADEEIQKLKRSLTVLMLVMQKQLRLTTNTSQLFEPTTLNKYITDYLTSVNAISTIQQKANTDARLVELKHQNIAEN